MTAEPIALTAAASATCSDPSGAIVRMGALRGTVASTYAIALDRPLRAAMADRDGTLIVVHALDSADTEAWARLVRDAPDEEWSRLFGSLAG